MPLLLSLAHGLFAAVVAASSPPEIELIGSAAIAGDAADLSGLTDTLSEGTPHNRFGSFGSAIEYTGRGHRYIAANDRGPADGASEFRVRTQTLDIHVLPSEPEPVTVSLITTTLLTGQGGRPLVGSIRPRNPSNLRYDAEGLRLSRTGTMWISDEYGPSIDEFAMDGRWLRALEVPARFRPASTPLDMREEFPPHARTGRFPNRGFEGLAISPDGSKLVAILQGPLIQDNAVDEAGTRTGVNVRILQMNCRDGVTREFVYTLSSPIMGVSEILAINDSRFLVLERDGAVGAASRHCAVYEIDLAGATDVSGRESLPSGTLPDGIVAASKRLFLDLTEARFGIAGPTMAEKFEGLAFGPDLADGRHVLLVTVDNDMRGEAPSLVYAFAIPRSALPALHRRDIAPAPKLERPTPRPSATGSP